VCTVMLGILLSTSGHHVVRTDGIAKPPMELRITLQQQSIVQCEPVVVFFELKNTSGEKQAFDPGIEPGQGNLIYRIVGPDGTVHRWHPPVVAMREGEKAVLKPNESMSHRDIVHYSGNWGFHFKQPGQYSVEATFLAGRVKDEPLLLRSNSVSVTARPAAGIDAKALERFGGHPQAKFALGTSTDFAIADEFEAIIRDYPTSVYAPWCYYFLARAWQNRFRDTPKIGAEKAIALYEESLDKHPKFPLTIEVRYQIAKEMLYLERRTEGLERIEELIAAHPNLRLLQRAKRAIEGLRKEGHEVTAQQLP